MLVFLAIIISMGHCIREELTDYCSRADNFHTTFYGSAMPWKIRNLFDILNYKFSKFYNPSEHLVVDEVIVKFKGRVIFRQYIPKKHKHFGIKIYKLCDETGYTYDMAVYL